MNVTEYVGMEGVVSSDLTALRATKPRSGDLVRWHDGTLGRIWETGGHGFTEADEVHVCSGLGSAFLGLLDDGRVYADISGGPFYMLKLADLRPTYELANATFWNWGDNMRGAGQGVEYMLARPVFEYVGDPAPIYDHKVAQTV